MRFIEIIDGAWSGVIETERSLPTSSSCGTITFSTAMTAIQPRMIGTANVRIIRGTKGRAAWRAGGSASVGASVVGALMRASPGLGGRMQGSSSYRSLRLRFRVVDVGRWSSVAWYGVMCLMQIYSAANGIGCGSRCKPLGPKGDGPHSQWN